MGILDMVSGRDLSRTTGLLEDTRMAVELAVARAFATARDLLRVLAGLPPTSSSSAPGARAAPRHASPGTRRGRAASPSARSGAQHAQHAQGQQHHGGGGGHGVHLPPQRAHLARKQGGHGTAHVHASAAAAAWGVEEGPGPLATDGGGAEVPPLRQRRFGAGAEEGVDGGASSGGGGPWGTEVEEEEEEGGAGKAEFSPPRRDSLTRDVGEESGRAAADGARGKGPGRPAPGSSQRPGTSLAAAPLLGGATAAAAAAAYGRSQSARLDHAVRGDSAGLPLVLCVWPLRPDRPPLPLERTSTQDNSRCPPHSLRLTVAPQASSHSPFAEDTVPSPDAAGPAPRRAAAPLSPVPPAMQSGLRASRAAALARAGSPGTSSGGGGGGGRTRAAGGGGARPPAGQALRRTASFSAWEEVVAGRREVVAGDVIRLAGYPLEVHSAVTEDG